AGRTADIAPNVLAGKVGSAAPGHSGDQPRERESVRGVQVPVVNVPVVGSKGAARQGILHPVVVASPASIDFGLAGAEQVVGAAEARGDLLVPSEFKGVVPNVAAERRNGL